MRHPALLFPVDPLRHCAQEVLHERGHAAVARGVDALAELAHGLVLDLALPHRRREQGGRGGAHLALDEVVPAFVVVVGGGGGAGGGGGGGMVVVAA